MTTLSANADVIAAGNYSNRLDEAVINFYRELASTFLSDMIGATRYADAVAMGTVFSISQIDRLKKSESLMAVGLSLPAVAVAITSSGMIKQLSMGNKGVLEVASFSKEVTELAASFMGLAKYLVAEFVSGEKFDSVWCNVIQRVFPGLDEYPTVATIGSDEETIIKQERGDIAYNPSTMG